MEKALSPFRCIFKMAKLLGSKLCALINACTPTGELQSYCPYATIIAIAWATIFGYLYIYVMCLLPSTLSTFSKDSFLSGVIFDGYTLSNEVVYFFNITNAEDFLERGAALNVTEVGPYVYRVWTHKIDRKWDAENQTMSFNEERDYDFFPDVSKGSLDDEIITWNGPFIIVAESLKKYNRSFKQEFLSSLNLTVESVIVKKKVKELVFGPYHDDLLKEATLANLKVPGDFSWLKHRLKERAFTVSTRDSDPGIVRKFNGRDDLGIWNGDACNKIKGSFGKVGPPIPSKDSPYSVFLPDLCRSLTLPRADYGHSSRLWAYEVTEKTFANSTENPDNYCFETRGSRPSGVYSVSSCHSRAPLWLSFPHFHMADPSYARNINGLKPDRTVHHSYFRVSRKFGWGLEMKLSIQMNIEIGEMCDVPPFNHISKGIYPILWSTIYLIEKDLSLVPNVVSKVQRAFYSYPMKIFWFFMWVMMVLVMGKYFSWFTFLKEVPEKIRTKFNELRIRKAENNEGDQADSNEDGREPPEHESVLLEIKN